MSMSEALLFFRGMLTSIVCSSCCQVYVGTRGGMMVGEWDGEEQGKGDD